MKGIAVASRVKVSVDGRGVVPHAGMGLVRELADLAAPVVDGADCIDGVGQLCGDREHVFGAKASTTTMWRTPAEASEYP